MTSRVFAAKIISKMKPGESYTVPWQELMTIEIDSRIAYPIDNVYNFPIQDWILEHIIGSAYEFGYYEDVVYDRIIFFRLKEPLNDGRLAYVSPDRRDRYNKNMHGIYELK